MGLNVDNREPTTCLNELLVTLHPGVRQVSREECLAQLMNSFEPLHRVFRSQGEASVQSPNLSCLVPLPWFLCTVLYSTRALCAVQYCAAL